MTHKCKHNKNDEIISIRNQYNCILIAITSVGEDVEKREPLCTVGGNVNYHSHYGKQYGSSSKNKNRTTI